MYQAILVFHVLLGLGVIGLVLMQQGKGADAGAAFGSGASGSVFGAQGAMTFLSRSTAIFAVLFFSTSLGLAVFTGNNEAIKGFMDDTEELQVEEQPINDLPDIGGMSDPVSVPSMSDQKAVENIPASGAMNGSSIDEPVRQDIQVTEEVEVIEIAPGEDSTVERPE